MLREDLRPVLELDCHLQAGAVDDDARASLDHRRRDAAADAVATCGQQRNLASDQSGHAFASSTVAPPGRLPDRDGVPNGGRRQDPDRYDEAAENLIVH
jgi:hypothetical protein